LIALTVSLLLSSTVLTLQNTGEIDIFDKNFDNETRTSWVDSSPYIRENSDGQENLSVGYLSASAQYGIEPGKYTVEVEPAGENITLYLKDGEKTIEKRFNESISFESEITTNSVWIGIIIRDPLTFQEHDGESFEINFVKEDELLNSPIMFLWSIASMGVIYLGVNNYRKKRD